MRLPDEPWWQTFWREVEAARVFTDVANIGHGERADVEPSENLRKVSQADAAAQRAQAETAGVRNLLRVLTQTEHGTRLARLRRGRQNRRKKRG
jgi:hypothetical protein